MIDPAVTSLLMSPTFSKIAELAGAVPVRVDDQAELKTAIARLSFCLIQALDRGGILFETEIDKATFYGLLSICSDIVLGGQLHMAARPPDDVLN